VDFDFFILCFFDGAEVVVVVELVEIDSFCCC